MSDKPNRPDPATDTGPEFNLPGLDELRETVANHAQSRLPSSSTLRQDAVAGLNSAINGVPDGMASGILAGVNPIYGLYGGMIGPLVGGLLASSRLMTITTTSASAVAAGQALSDMPFGDRERSLFALVIIVGIIQIVAGLLKLGRYTRFVSYSVLTGFLLGVSVLLILSQLSTTTGFATTGDNTVVDTADLLRNLNQIDLWTLVIAIGTLILAIILPRSRLGSFGMLAAIVLPSLFVVVFGLESVEIVRDVGEIPGGIPELFVPRLSDVTASAFTGAFAVAIIILVQGAGVSQSVPNPDGSRSRASRDFLAQGAANVASGALRGVPVGGSLSSTALNVVSGAMTRWAAIFTGLWMAILVIGLPRLVSYIAMPALGALLILAGVKSIKPKTIRSIWSAGWTSILVAVTVFVSTLLLPIQAAVGYGVVLSILLYVVQSSTDVQLVQLIKRSDGRVEERPPPRQLPGNEVTVLDIYGNLFFASARTMERMLPVPEGGVHAVVIIRLRGQKSIGATLIDVLAAYANKLEAASGLLYLTGVNAETYGQIVNSGKIRLTGTVRAYEMTPILGKSTNEAYTEARAWLVRIKDETAPGE